METEKPKRWPFHKVTCCDGNGDADDVDADVTQIIFKYAVSLDDL